MFFDLTKNTNNTTVNQESLPRCEHVSIPGHSTFLLGKSANLQQLENAQLVVLNSPVQKLTAGNVNDIHRNTVWKLNGESCPSDIPTEAFVLKKLQSAGHTTARIFLQLLAQNLFNQITLLFSAKESLDDAIYQYEGEECELMPRGDQSFTTVLYIDTYPQHIQVFFRNYLWYSTFTMPGQIPSRVALKGIFNLEFKLNLLPHFQIKQEKCINHYPRLPMRYNLFEVEICQAIYEAEPNYESYIEALGFKEAFFDGFDSRIHSPYYTPQGQLTPTTLRTPTSPRTPPTQITSVLYTGVNPEELAAALNDLTSGKYEPKPYLPSSLPASRTHSAATTAYPSPVRRIYRPPSSQTKYTTSPPVPRAPPNSTAKQALDRAPRLPSLSDEEDDPF